MSKRIQSLDVIKFIAMLGVMCLHSEKPFYANPISRFLYMTAVVSIPLFFLTSGYLLYGKDTVTYRYCLHKILGIIRFVAIITVCYWIVIGLKHGYHDFFGSTIGSLLQYGPFGVFWYFGAMIIIYALSPLLHYLYTSLPKVFFWVTIALLVIASAVFCLNFFGIEIEQNTIQTFRVWNWLLYFNIGGLLRRYPLRSNGLCVIFFMILNLVFQLILTPLLSTQYCEYFYPSIPVILFSVSVFNYINTLDFTWLKYALGGVFLPCYTFHSPIIWKTINVFNTHCGFFGLMQGPIYWLFICIATLIASGVVMKIPYMNRVFKI